MIIFRIDEKLWNYADHTSKERGSKFLNLKVQFGRIGRLSDSYSKL